MTFSMDDYNFKNTLSSFYCGKGVDYELCDTTCASGRKFSGAGTHKMNTVGLFNHDFVKTVTLRPYDPRKQGAVNVFGGTNCDELSDKYYAPLNEGDIAEFIDTKWIRSMKIPPGVTV